MKEGWEYKKLGEVCKILNGFAFKSNKYVEKGIRVIRITNVQKGSIVDNDPKYYPFEEEPNIKQYLLSDSDLLMSLTGNVGRVGILQQDLLPAALNQRVACLRISSNKLLLKYLFHFLNSDGFENDCIFNAAGIAQKNMSTEWLKKYIVPLPPLSEQQRIVEELDLLSSIIEKKKEQLKELDNLAQSIFYDMFGDPVTNEKGWEVKKLGDEFEVSSGGTPSTGRSEYWDNGNVSWIGSNMCQNQVIYENDGKYITKEGLEHSSAKLYHKGFVLVALVGATIGKVALLGFNTTTNQNIAGINVPKNKDYTPFFIYFLLQFLYCMFENIGEGKFKMANLTFIRSLPIIKPPLPLQQQFASKIEAIEKQKELIKQSIKEVETLFSSRMDYYFN